MASEQAPLIPPEKSVKAKRKGTILLVSGELDKAILAAMVALLLHTLLAVVAVQELLVETE